MPDQNPNSAVGGAAEAPPLQLFGDEVLRALGGYDFARRADSRYIKAYEQWAAASADHPRTRVDGMWREIVLLATHAAHYEWGAVQAHLQLATEFGATAEELLQVLEIVATAKASAVLYFGGAELKTLREGNRSTQPKV